MSDLPRRVDVHEEGPREGFQIEPGPIPTADKIKLIEALAETGLHHIQACSFVNTRLVPGWADAEAVVEGFKPKPGVDYTALWFNANGLERALAYREKLTMTGSISLTASEGFTRKNLNRSHEENVAAMKKQTALHLSHGIPVKRIGVMAAFGCNYQGDISPAQVVKTLEDGMAIAAEAGAKIEFFSLADTMGWAIPPRIERVIGTVRAKWPEMRIGLHLHEEPYLGNNPIIGRDTDQVIEADMVFSIEPLCYRTGHGYGMQLKDMIRVTADGCELLSDYANTDTLQLVS